MMFCLQPLRLAAGVTLAVTALIACSTDETPSTPTSTGMTRWVKTDLRTGQPKQIQLAAARFAETCRSQEKSGIGVAVTGAVSLGATLPTLPDTAATRLACALDAPRGASCEDLKNCAGIRATPGTNPTCDSETLMVRMLEGKSPASIACAAFGEKCFNTRVGGMCGVSPCSKGETYSCDGDTIVSCMQGVRTRNPCGHGMTCGAQSGSGLLDCIGSGKSCSGPDHCEGDTLVRCVTPPGGKGLEARTNCKDWGLGCVEAGGIAECTATGTECKTAKDAATCDGKQLKMCVAGHWWKVSCDSLVAGTSCVSGTGFKGEAGCSK